MSRLKKFTHSLVSGYVSVGANIFYTLASVPLALHYLGKPEFGLWALVAQISGYIALIDFGMANSVSRFLIDHKDDRRDGAYGSVIKTSVLVGLVQGGLIILAGGVLALLAGSALHVPPMICSGNSPGWSSGNHCSPACRSPRGCSTTCSSRISDWTSPITDIL